MHIINLTPLAEGVYNDHKADHITFPPEGWAVILHEGDPIPKEWEGKEIDYSLPSTFPRLGSIEAEELTYTREVEVQKKVTKTQEITYTNADGEEVTEEVPYTEKVTVTEEREYKMLTVTAMTEGTLPEPVETEPVKSPEERIAELEEALELLLSGDTGEVADDEA